MSILETTICRYVARGEAVPGYLVTMECGAPYLVTWDGNIIRTDMPFEPSGQWRAVAVHTSRGARLSGWHIFAPHMAGDDAPMTFKNGKPMYRIGDFDHGTYRIQGHGMLRVKRAVFSRGADGRWSLS